MPVRPSWCKSIASLFPYISSSLAEAIVTKYPYCQQPRLDTKIFAWLCFSGRDNDGSNKTSYKKTKARKDAQPSLHENKKTVMH